MDMLPHTIMIRDRYGGSDPIRTSVETKSPKHAPVNKHKYIRNGVGKQEAAEQIRSIPSSRRVFSIEVRQDTFKILDVPLIQNKQ